MTSCCVLTKCPAVRPLGHPSTHPPQEGEEEDKGKSVREEEEEEEEEASSRASFRLCQLLWRTCVCRVGLVQGWGGRVGRGVGAL